MTGYILELQIDNFPTTVSLSDLYLNIYRRRGVLVSRIAQLPAGRQYFQDLAGTPGDQYFSVWYDNRRRVEGGPSGILTATSAPLQLVAVSGFICGPDGESIGQDVEVAISLFSGSPAPTTANGQHIASSLSVLTDTTGTWQALLTPNDLIRPAGTYWKFHILSRTHFKTISSTLGAAQNFSLLPDATPFDAR